jgi:divalent metal cation (Fe/Co/Zn/Cd) transporter
MAELVQLGSQARRSACDQSRRSGRVIWLQVVTLAWMLIECGVSIYTAKTAHSPALLAFGSDSVVELLSATVVLLQYIPGISIAERKASRAASILLFVLVFVVGAIAISSFILGVRAESSPAGMIITAAALIAMPILAALKRREARRRKDAALAADAVQSATCAYLAFTTLAGLALNAAFHISWIDPLAALVAIPFLLKEGRSAWQGHSCSCC